MGLSWNLTARPATNVVRFLTKNNTIYPSPNIFLFRWHIFVKLEMRCSRLRNNRKQLIDDECVVLLETWRQNTAYIDATHPGSRNWSSKSRVKTILFLFSTIQESFTKYLYLKLRLWLTQFLNHLLSLCPEIRLPRLTRNCWAINKLQLTPTHYTPQTWATRLFYIFVGKTNCTALKLCIWKFAIYKLRSTYIFVGKHRVVTSTTKRFWFRVYFS